MKNVEPKEMSVREAATKGGMTTLKRKGRKHFKKISKMGVEARRANKETKSE